LREWGKLFLSSAVNGENRGALAAERRLPYNPAMTVECTAGPFKICGSCRRAWPTWDSFVLDPAVRLLGLQSDINKPDINLLVFEHGCGSSISILSRRLRHLLPEPEPGDPPALLMGTDQCRGHCLHLEDLEACDALCSNAPDRELILLVQRMKRGIRAL
jgi:hypothetical protein